MDDDASSHCNERWRVLMAFSLRVALPLASLGLPLGQGEDESNGGE